MSGVLAVAADLFQIAHEWAFPHTEPTGERSGGLSVIVILAGIVVTLGAVAGLVWLKGRVERQDAEEPQSPPPPDSGETVPDA